MLEEHSLLEEIIPGINGTIPLNVTVAVGGDGIWTTHKAKVLLIKMQIEAIRSSDGMYLRDVYFYFDPSTWDVVEHGLIYTDETFLREVNEKVLILPQVIGFGLTNLLYTEHGHQGREYVSMSPDDIPQFTTRNPTQI